MLVQYPSLMSFFGTEASFINLLNDKILSNNDYNTIRMNISLISDYIAAHFYEKMSFYLYRNGTTLSKDYEIWGLKVLNDLK